jgi:hypothetical protein
LQDKAAEVLTAAVMAGNGNGFLQVAKCSFYYGFYRTDENSGQSKAPCNTKVT